MKRSPKLTKQAREVIEAAMRDAGELTTEAAVEIVKPHLMLDPQELIRSELLRTVQRVMRGIKGEAGKRVCFNVKGKVDSIYVNIDTTTSMSALDGVERQLNAQFYGLRESKLRIGKRRRVLESRKPKEPQDKNAEDKKE